MEHYSISDNLKRMVSGENETVFRLLEGRFCVEIQTRLPGLNLKPKDGADLQGLLTVLDQLKIAAKHGESFTAKQVERLLGKSSPAVVQDFDLGAAPIIRNRFGISIGPKTPSQAELVKAVEKNDVIFAKGPAGTGKTFLQKTYLIVKADKPEAMIYIDDELVNTGEASKSVNIGTTHTYKIECNLYHEENGTVTVNERMTIEKKLRPNFGYINVSTSPEQGAKVFVDGDYLGVSPIKTDKLASGTHTVRVMKDMYKMKEQSFTVTDGQTTNANLTMSANFVTLTVNTDADSDIYVDEDYKGRGRWTGRVSEGLHNLEARKQNHRSSKTSVDLVLGENKTIALEAPQPISGSIDVNSSPMSAEIYIDGKHYGQTPNYINEILIGTHTLKLEKQGCATITKTIKIKENETLTVNEKLQTGKEITIKTDKSGDKVYVDDNYVGLSPVTTSLAFGSHTIKAEHDGKYVNKTINVSQYGGDNSVMLAFVQKINGHEYVDLGLSVKWATCNVGASKPEDYGNYYAWGETSTKSTYYEINSKTCGKQMNDIKGNSQYDAARANWGGTWRLPTRAELEELKNKCTWRWTTQNGVKGYKVTGPNGNHIFLPATGYRNESSLYYAGEDGYYRSSTPYESFSDLAYYLYFRSGGQHVSWLYRYYGLSVRPVSE
ncbi:MAG: PEGA domain-containing protein [Fibrobacter sp.]|nr:PEGA domain-containing protein [Fibrobacter sp.]